MVQDPTFRFFGGFFHKFFIGFWIYDSRNFRKYQESPMVFPEVTVDEFLKVFDARVIWLLTWITFTRTYLRLWSRNASFRSFSRVSFIYSFRVPSRSLSRYFFKIPRFQNSLVDNVIDIFRYPFGDFFRDTSSDSFKDLSWNSFKDPP